MAIEDKNKWEWDHWSQTVAREDETYDCYFRGKIIDITCDIAGLAYEWQHIHKPKSATLEEIDSIKERLENLKKCLEPNGLDDAYEYFD